MKNFLLTLMLFTAIACSKKTSVNEDDFNMDLRYAPVWGQTAICLPDDNQKTIVDNYGIVYYDYANVMINDTSHTGPFNGCCIGMFPGLDTLEVKDTKQNLYSSKVPILLTSCNKNNIIFSTEIFTVAPSLKSSPEDSSELSKGFRGMPHNDIIIVKIKNTNDMDTKISPKFFIKSVYPVSMDKDKKRLSIDNRITVSLPEGVVSLIKKPYGRYNFYTVLFDSILVKQGEEKSFAYSVNIGNKASQISSSISDARVYKTKSIEYWDTYKFPYENIVVPDSNVQNLVYSSIRNIYQAREIKNGMPSYQVGPTCYRSLWIVDGAFLLESMSFLRQIKDVRNGIEYMLTFQKESGEVKVMDEYWKETGIVLWVIKRHAQLSGDLNWLNSKWDNVVRAVTFIDTLMLRAMQDKNAPHYGLVPPGHSDGGLWPSVPEFTNVYWILNGLKSAVDVALLLKKDKEVAIWKSKFDTLFVNYQKAAKSSLKTDSCGNKAVPTFIVDSCQIQRAQWAFCQAVFPGKIFENKDPLMLGTINMLKCNEKEGLVYETGWLDKGVWNYFGSFYAHAWLWIGDGQKAAKTMYAMANHASPTLVWREEQPLKSFNSREIVGDMPHNWASAEFIRMIRHFIALERGTELHLFEALPPTWTKPGMRTALKGIYTEFGILDVELVVSQNGKKADINIDLNSENHHKPSSVEIHLDGLKGEKEIISCKPNFPIHETISL